MYLLLGNFCDFSKKLKICQLFPTSVFSYKVYEDIFQLYVACFSASFHCVTNAVNTVIIILALFIKTRVCQFLFIFCDVNPFTFPETMSLWTLMWLLLQSWGRFAFKKKYIDSPNYTNYKLATPSTRLYTPALHDLCLRHIEYDRLLYFMMQ